MCVPASVSARGSAASLICSTVPLFRSHWMLHLVYTSTPVRLSSDSWAFSVQPTPTRFSPTHVHVCAHTSPWSRKHGEETVVVSEWGADVMRRRDGQAGGDWQAVEYEGEYQEFTHNETCQFECLKAKEWAGHGWWLRWPFLLNNASPWPWPVVKKNRNYTRMEVNCS